MEVRLTTTLEVPYAVQDATGTVISIEVDHNDAAVHEHNLKDPVLQNLKPEILLHKLPTAVLIKLHDCKQFFLPAQPCFECTMPTATCTECIAKRTALEGVFAVEPIPRTWKYEGPQLNCKFANVKRRQFPLAPARALPLYSMQGMTASPGLVAHWVVPPRLSSDIIWLI